MQAPKVSVLMAVYNRPELVKNAIESFLRQTYSNAELLICDDCSTDHTPEVINDYAIKNKNIKWYKNNANKKFLPTINWLFSIADGEYVCICDSDDEMSDDRLEHQLRIIKECNADAVLSGLARIDNQGSVIFNKPLWDEQRQIRPNSDEVIISTGSLFMHHSVLDKVKGYHSYFADSFCGDIYFINSIATNFKLIYDPKPVYYYRLTEGSMTQKFNLYQLSKLELSKFLIKQRQDTGTDFLEQNNFEDLEIKRAAIMCNRKWRAEQYRLYAARAIDEQKTKIGLKMILSSFQYNPLALINYKTLWYLIRTSFKGKFLF